jgi:hypothetical protein
MSVVEVTGDVPESGEMHVREGPVVKKDWRQEKTGGPIISRVNHRVRTGSGAEFPVIMESSTLGKMMISVCFSHT